MGNNMLKDNMMEDTMRIRTDRNHNGNNGNKRKQSRRYKKVQQKRIKAFFSIMAMLFIVVVCTSMFSLKTRANSFDGANDYKYYANYCIEPGESIWSIAADHMDYAHYDSIHQYAKEIQKINKINSDHVTNGTYIMLPYYDEQLK